MGFGEGFGGVLVASRDLVIVTLNGAEGGICILRQTAGPSLHSG